MNAENKGIQTLKERWLYILKAESLSFQKAGALQVNLSASSWFSCLLVTYSLATGLRSSALGGDNSWVVMPNGGECDGIWNSGRAGKKTLILL